MSSEAPSPVNLQDSDSQQLSAAETCAGCSLRRDEEYSSQTGLAVVSEIFEDSLAQARSHAFELSGTGIEKHSFIFRGTAISETPKLRVVIFENLPANLTAEEIEISSELLKIHLWARQAFGIPIDEDFSSLWWNSHQGLLRHPLHLTKWGRERKHSEESASSSAMISIPVTRFTNSYTYEELARLSDSVLTKTIWWSGSPFLSGPSSWNVGNPAWQEGFEQLLISEKPLRDGSIIETVLVLRVFSKSRHGSFFTHDKHWHLDSDPWFDEVFRSGKDNCVTFTSSSTILNRIITSLELGRLLVPSSKERIVLWALEELIPYLDTLLAFEISVLSPQLEEIKDFKRSELKQGVLRRCERKLLDIKRSKDAARMQLEFIFTTLDDSKESLECRTRCDELQKRIEVLDSNYVQSLGRLETHKQNVFADLQIELTNTQIKESRLAIAQAGTVTKLTILAFVFIPISAVTGIFEMNVKEVTDGTRLWMFGVTVVAVVAGTVTLALFGSILSLWRRFYEHHFYSRYSRPRLLTLIMLPLNRTYRWARNVKFDLLRRKREGEALRKRDHNLQAELYESIHHPTSEPA